MEYEHPSPAVEVDSDEWHAGFDIDSDDNWIPHEAYSPGSPHATLPPHDDEGMLGRDVELVGWSSEDDTGEPPQPVTRPELSLGSIEPLTPPELGNRFEPELGCEGSIGKGSEGGDNAAGIGKGNGDGGRDGGIGKGSHGRREGGAWAAIGKGSNGGGADAGACCKRRRNIY